MPYVMGVDGGGSQTTVAIADERGRLISIGRAHGANHQTIGIDAAVSHIDQAVQEALAQSNLNPRDIAFVYYGLAGADRPRDFDILRVGLARLPFPRWRMVSDAWEGLRAGTDDYVGVSLVCGSGSNAVGRSASGKEVQVGGFGYAFGDAAGGSHLAVETFRAAVRAYQGRGAATELVRAVPDFLGYPDMDHVYNSFLDNDCHIPLDLVLVLHQVAHQGDAVAQKILTAMGCELGLAAIAVLQQLQGIEDKPIIPLVLVGSIVQKAQSPFVLETLAQTVHERYPTVRLRPLDVPPVFGSVLLALDCLDLVADGVARKTFRDWEESENAKKRS
jgi:N-acetylglucosamine kinase-like BadF-type ATPase